MRSPILWTSLIMLVTPAEASWISICNEAPIPDNATTYWQEYLQPDGAKEELFISNLLLHEPGFP